MQTSGRARVEVFKGVAEEVGEVLAKLIHEGLRIEARFLPVLKVAKLSMWFLAGRGRNKLATTQNSTIHILDS